MSEKMDAKELLRKWADRAECSLKKGIRIVPPEEIFDHLDLLGRGWGWDMLAPCSGSNYWIAYQNYLEQYYLHNRPESVAQALQDEKSIDSNVLTPLGCQEAYAAGNGIGDGSAASYGAGNAIRDGGDLVPFISSCVKMEKEFIAECERQCKEAYGPANLILSKVILARALSLQIPRVKFPVAAAALMCIAKITELMLEWLRQGINIRPNVTQARRYAFNFMEYTGSNHVCAAAVMVGIAKEVVTIRKCLKKGVKLDTIPWSLSTVNNASNILHMLFYELIGTSNDNGTVATEAGSSPEIITVEKDCKELGNSSDERDPRQIRQLAENWVTIALENLKIGLLCVPPQGIFNHLDLLEKGWGFKRLVPYCGSEDWSAYKNYLHRYYESNNPEHVAQEWKNEKADSAAGNNKSDGIGLTTFSCLQNGTENGSGLDSIVSLCVNMEKKFVAECEKQGNGGDDDHHIILSKEIQKHALSLKSMDGKFPVATAALMLIMKKAELLCEWLKQGTFNPGSKVMNVRQFAVNLMLYNDSGYTCAAAVMVGIAKETKMICEHLRKSGVVTDAYSKLIMENGWEVLKMVHDEIEARTDSTNNKDSKEQGCKVYKNNKVNMKKSRFRRKVLPKVGERTT